MEYKKIPEVKFPTIPRVDYVQRQMVRATQRDILPAVIKNRNLNQNMIVSNPQTSFASSTFTSGQTLRLTSTSTQVKSQPMVMEKYWSAYIGSVTQANNIFNGTASTAGLLIRGPVFDENRWDGNKYVSTSTLIIENVSYGSITILAFAREKIFLLADAVTTS